MTIPIHLCRPCPPGTAPIGSACLGTRETAAQVRWRREVLMRFTDEEIERLEALDAEFERAAEMWWRLGCPPEPPWFDAGCLRPEIAAMLAAGLSPRIVWLQGLVEDRYGAGVVRGQLRRPTHRGRDADRARRLAKGRIG